MNEAQISKQHPIPQNFMDVEFKIVGDFTVRQFTYLCVTGIPMYLIFNSPVQSFLKTIILVILGIFGFLLVFVPIDDRSMDVWIVNFFKSVYSNNRRVWRKTPVIPSTLSMEAIKIVQGEMITLAPTSSRRKLEEYLKGIKEEEVDEYDFNFSKHSYKEDLTAPKKVLDETQEVVQKPTSEKSIEVKPIEEVVLKIPGITAPEVKTTVPTEFAKKITQPVTQIAVPLKQILKPKPKVEKNLDIHEDFRTSTTDVPGRKFVSFSERDQDLILPIRGEKTININLNSTQKANASSSSKDIKTLTKELRTLVREIKHEEPNSITIPATSEVNLENNITGICFDTNNNPLPNLMLSLIDDQNKEMQYARSDNLGKFIFRNTPTGSMKIKVLNPEIYSLNFDIINLNISKYPYSLIQIIGKK